VKISALLEWLEALGGARPLPAHFARSGWLSVARGLGWLVLLLVAWAFAGRATKFIYIDF
jgi:hypothetical protein